MDDGELREAFSSACPNCGGGRICPEMQRNNFAHTATVTPGGDVESGTDCVSVTRWSSCDDCGHVWAETVATEHAHPSR